MVISRRRLGAVNGFYVWGLGSVVVVVALSAWLFSGNGRVAEPDSDLANSARPQDGDNQGDPSTELVMYCAAGMRYPLEIIVADYRREYGGSVRLQYGGSNTLLSQLEVNKNGDLYLAGDDSYIRLARQKGLAEEVFSLAQMRPVIVVRKGNPKKIQGVADLTRKDVRVALGEPTAAAIGKKTKRLLSASGHWRKLEPRVTVFKDTVNFVANDVNLKSVDAGIVWDSTVAQYPELTAIRSMELDAGVAKIEMTVLKSSRNPQAALRFARYVSARDKGLITFRRKGFDVLEGDKWDPAPEINLFAGAVNRRALAPIVKEFENREGVKINTVYNGCGILTGQMRLIKKNQDSGFPDSFLACDVYYLKTVENWFQDAVNVSDTDIVIVTQKGNPKNIKSLSDLARSGVRIGIGQPEQCTIGVLSKRLLQSEGLYDKVVKHNLQMQATSSANLVPNVATGHLDAVLAYRTDTLAERSRIEVVSIKSPLAKAVQPFSIARTSDFKQMSRRLFAKIRQSRAAFETAGFNWRLSGPGGGPKQFWGRSGGEN